MVLRFAGFELDRGAYELRRSGQVVHLERIPLDAVRKIRRPLGDDADAPRFVITLPAKGYRFIADVCEESQTTPEKPGAQPQKPLPTSAAPAGRLAGGHFISRAEEMAGLHAAIDAALGGQASLLILVGEPGIGKTRLAEEAGAYGRQRGAQVLVGHCYEGEAASPYSSFVEAIREYVSTRPDDALRAVMGESASDLVKLVPEIRRHVPDLTAVPAARDPQEDQMRLFESVASGQRLEGQPDHAGTRGPALGRQGVVAAPATSSARQGFVQPAGEQE